MVFKISQIIHIDSRRRCRHRHNQRYRYTIHFTRIHNLSLWIACYHQDICNIDTRNNAQILKNKCVFCCMLWGVGNEVWHWKTRTKTGAPRGDGAPVFRPECWQLTPQDFLQFRGSCARSPAARTSCLQPGCAHMIMHGLQSPQVGAKMVHLEATWCVNSVSF